MNIFFKMKNFATCAMFCRRLLELNPGAKVRAHTSGPLTQLAFCSSSSACHVRACSWQPEPHRCAAGSREGSGLCLVLVTSCMIESRCWSQRLCMRTADGAAGEAGARGMREEPQRCSQTGLRPAEPLRRLLSDLHADLPGCVLSSRPFCRLSCP